MTGLSPRVRGNLELTDAFPTFLTRSIPACAGEPRRRRAPRVCANCDGRHFTILPGLRVRGNRDEVLLSPRVRGNLARVDRRNVLRRSIPACAGEPCRVTVRRIGFATCDAYLTVYPRVCGGTLEIRHCRHSLSLSRSVRIAEITRDLACITSRRSRSARFRHRGEQ